MPDMEDHVPVCQNCSYSDDAESHADPAEGRWLLCRRRPPVTFGAALDGYGGGPGVFPRVAAQDWCGEWVLSVTNTDAREQTTYLAWGRLVMDA